MRGLSAAGWLCVAAFILTINVLPASSVIPDTDLAFLLSSNKPMPSRADSGGFVSLIKPILWTILIAALLFGGLAAAYARRKREQGSALIQVLAATPVAQGVMVQVIDVAGILYVVSSSRTGQILLGEISDREKISEIRSRVAGESLELAIPPIPFKAALEKFFKRPAGAGAEDKTQPKTRQAREALLRDALERVRRMDPSDKNT